MFVVCYDVVGFPALSTVFIVGILCPGRLLQQNFRGGAGGNPLQQPPAQQPQQVRAYPANNFGEWSLLLKDPGNTCCD